MKRRFCQKANQAWTLIELFVVIALLAILAAMILPPSLKTKSRSKRAECVSNLKQIALAFRIWEADHEGKFPMAIVGTNGGTLEWVVGGNASRHFQVMSNELSTPSILICPTDGRAATADFRSLKNEHLSYFVGLDASSNNPAMFLAGDRNITNGLAPQQSVQIFPPDHPAGWTDYFHSKYGNVALADGSVQSFSSAGLCEALKHTGDATNRIALPE